MGKTVSRKMQRKISTLAARIAENTFWNHKQNCQTKTDEDLLRARRICQTDNSFFLWAILSNKEWKKIISKFDIDAQI